MNNNYSSSSSSPMGGDIGLEDVDVGGGGYQLPPSYEESRADTREPYVKLSREEKFRQIIRKFEISNEYAQRLQQLVGFKIVFVFDDSGSMNTILQDSPLNTAATLFRATRWDELRHFSEIAIQIATLFDQQGCDIYFLNRQPSPLRRVTDPSQLADIFKEPPSGYTPLPRVLSSLLTDNHPSTLNERKLLVIIATDGEPTDDTGRTAVREFKQALKSRAPVVFTTVVVCTDDEESVRYLNRWDRKLPRLDVVDDYRNEREEVKKAKGRGYSFTFGDYVVKSLVGSIDPELDRMDEQNSCCAVI